jgi:hypothetical protein
MNRFSFKTAAIAATAATAILSAGTVGAQESQSQSNEIMMGFNPFTSDDLSVTAPSWMVGLKADERLLPYGYVSIADPGGNADTAFAVGGGARLYISDMSNRIRPFAGAAFGLLNQDDTGFGLGGFFGAEAMITDGLSVSGQVGMEIQDRGCDACDTTFELGTANVMFNLYF